MADGRTDPIPDLSLSLRASAALTAEALPGLLRPKDRVRTGAGRAIGFVTPTGPGSLGDQAMLEGATAYITGRGGAARVFPNGPELRSGAWVAPPGGRLATLCRTGQGVLSAGTVVYIGADVLDGSYSAAAVTKRLRVLAAAHRLGRRTRVMGSSWSETPSPEVIAALKAAPWLEVLARDPVSRARMEADLGREIRQVADLAFLMVPEARSPAAEAAVAWARAQAAGGATILAVNLSGHVIRDLPDASVAPFAGLVGRWLDADPARRVLILPHDTRPGMGGDLTVSADLAAALGQSHPGRVHLPGGRLDAWDAKAIAGEVDLVLTGRMHLAIAALGMGVPPVSLVYRNKFEGLMAQFGLEGLLLAPDQVGRTPEADDALARTTAGRAALGARIRAALPGTIALSRENFAGL